MSSLNDLAAIICQRLEVSDENQKRCITNILSDTIAFSDYVKGGLDETRLEHLVKLISGFVTEIKNITKGPEYFDEKLNKIKELVVRQEREYP
jgi:Tfp pilus assembly ATPase PilU